MTDDDRRRELREAFIEARGFWTPLRIHHQTREAT
jgi:hypothetical protein